MRWYLVNTFLPAILLSPFSPLSPGLPCTQFQDMFYMENIFMQSCKYIVYNVYKVVYYIVDVPVGPLVQEVRGPPLVQNNPSERSLRNMSKYYYISQPYYTREMSSVMGLLQRCLLSYLKPWWTTVSYDARLPWGSLLKSTKIRI